MIIFDASEDVKVVSNTQNCTVLCRERCKRELKRKGKQTRRSGF